MIKLCSFGLLYLLLPVTFCLAADNDTLRRVDCLLGLEFYHPESDQCFPALERGPCDQDDWLVPDPSDPGLGGCQRMTLPATGCEAVILESGEPGCAEDVKEDNEVAFIKVKFKGKLEGGRKWLQQN